MASLPKITTEQITDIVRRFGPILPIELAKKIGADSYIAKAFLSQLIDSKQLRITNERVGNEYLYFVPGQEVAARARLQTFGLKQSEVLASSAKNISVGKVGVTASTYGTPQKIVSSELQKKQEQFLKRLREIEEREVKQKKLKTVLPITVEDVRVLFSDKPVAVGGEILSKLKDLQIESAVVEKVKELIEEETGIKTQEFEEEPKAKITYTRKYTEPITPEIKLYPKHKENVETIEISTLRDERPDRLIQSKISEEGIGVIQAIGYITGVGGKIISKELLRRGKDAEIIVEINSAVGPMKMLAVIRDKKVINDGDLSVAYNSGIDRKLPVLFLTQGKLTKKAEEYAKSVDLLTIKKIGE